MKKEDLKKVVIHCTTEEEAIQCCELADKLGWRWEGATSYKYNYWKEYKEKTCYNFYKGYYQKKEWYKSRSYEIKSAQWFIDNFSLEKKNVFVYIRGVKDRGQEVIDTLVKLDGTNHLGLNGTNPNRLYYIASNGTIVYAEDDCSRNSIWVKNHYTEIFLSKQKYEFKPFDKVLVRYSNIAPWQVDLYSHYDEEEIADPDDGSYHLPHICVGGCYEDCIPYEGNEYLLGTTNNPKEE